MTWLTTKVRYVNSWNNIHDDKPKKTEGLYKYALRSFGPVILMLSSGHHESGEDE
jgi:hypothetical protein